VGARGVGPTGRKTWGLGQGQQGGPQGGGHGPPWGKGGTQPITSTFGGLASKKPSRPQVAKYSPKLGRSPVSPIGRGGDLLGKKKKNPTVGTWRPGEKFSAIEGGGKKTIKYEGVGTSLLV